MRRTTQWLLVACYYISIASGICSFSYDIHTGRARTRPFITIYCAIMSLALFGVVPLVLRIDWQMGSSNEPNMHIKISGIMCWIHIIAVLVTVVWNWTKRSGFIRTLNDFQQLRQRFVHKWPISDKLYEKYENLLRKKLFWGFVANVVMMLGSVDVMSTQLQLEVPIVVTIALVGSLLNMVMTHYYVTLLSVNHLLEAINEEIMKIFTISAEISSRQCLKHIKRAALHAQCRKLARDLDELALTQYRLQSVGNRVNDMYDVQGACVMFTTYLSNVSIMYMSYMMVQHNSLAQMYNKWALCAISVGLCTYYVDLKIFLYVMLQFQALVEETGTLLKNRQTWLTPPDERLEKSFTNFSLQLAAFPVRMNLMGLFYFDRRMAFAMFGGTITNAIVLMQYDYKNYNFK